MSDKSWKARERVIARMFGTTRTPGSGSNLGTTRSDTKHERLYIELKCRKKLSKWFKELVYDTNLKACKENKIPLVILHEKGKTDDYCICQISDLISISEEFKNEKS